ncbi:MAG: hypothetical protein ACK5RC_14695 [Curvibacter sp.]
MTAFLETAPAIRRRRAFYAALVPLVGRDSALEAINIWEHAFGSEQPLLRGISQFAALIVAELKLQISPKDLSIKLLEHLQKDESTLPADPLPLLTGRARRPGAETRLPEPPAVGNTAPADTPRVSPATHTLSVLLVKLCDAAGQADARSQKALVSQFLAGCGKRFGAVAAQDIAALLSGRSAVLSLDYAPSNASSIINLFYVPLAELYGPISADRILSSAVRAVEQMAEARAFHPRDLL